MRLVVIAALIAVVCVAASTAFACGGGGMSKTGGETQTAGDAEV